MSVLSEQTSDAEITALTEAVTGVSMIPAAARELTRHIVWLVYRKVGEAVIKAYVPFFARGWLNGVVGKILTRLFGPEPTAPLFGA